LSYALLRCLNRPKCFCTSARPEARSATLAWFRSQGLFVVRLAAILKQTTVFLHLCQTRSYICIASAVQVPRAFCRTPCHQPESRAVGHPCNPCNPLYALLRCLNRPKCFCTSARPAARSATLARFRSQGLFVVRLAAVLKQTIVLLHLCQTRS